jgi:SAM-dependent methyltransferase
MTREPEPAATDPGYEQRRTSFAGVARAYAAVRPQWPAATVAWLTGTESTGPDPTGPDPTGPDPTGPDPTPERARALDVLDLGAGTGKLTTALLAAGHRVLAVDPSAQMLAELAAVAPQALVCVGAAEQIPADDACVDVVTVAQAWHWFDAERAAAQCRRVLRPGGLLAVAWHARDDRVDWVRELSVLAGHPDHAAARQRESGDGGHGPDPEAGIEQLRLGSTFGPVEVREFGYQQTLTRQQLVTLASTWSYVAVSARRAQILDAVDELAGRVAGPDGTLVVPHRTWCYRARARD